MEKSNGLKIIDLQMHNYMKVIEECIRMGRPCLCQNIHETIPEMLNPILVQSIHKVKTMTNQSSVLRLNDRDIDYNPSFRLYLSTRLANPRYDPEIFSRVTMINFAIKEQGLEEQLLGSSSSKRFLLIIDNFENFRNRCSKRKI